MENRMIQILSRSAALVICLSAGAALAQVSAPVRPSASAQSAAEQKSKRSILEAAVTDCESMWDRGTHMTKTEWSRTCRRVQNRLHLLEAK